MAAAFTMTDVTIELTPTTNKYDDTLGGPLIVTAAGADVTLTTCTFQGGSELDDLVSDAGLGASIISHAAGSLTITSCTF